MSVADLQGALSPDVQKLAQENTDAGLSTTARIDDANKKATQAIIANLNKKGILHSGQAGYELDQQNTGYRQAQSDAYDKFLGYLQQYQQGYLSAQNQRAQALGTAYNSAADRAVTQNQGSAGITAYPDHQDANGTWVFKGTDGNFYDPNGQAYSAPAPPPPPAAAAAPSGTQFGPADALARYISSGPISRAFSTNTNRMA
jgi:hypothetical protein